MERPEDIDNDEGRDEFNCADDGVDDVTLDAVGAVGLPAALIALCTDVLVFLFEGIVIRNEYLLKESDTKQNAMSKSCKLVAHPVYSTWVYSR